MTLWGANPVDVVVLVVVLVSALAALLRGFVAEVLSLAGWLAAAFVTARFHGEVLPLAEGYLGKGYLSLAASVAGLFLGTLVITSAISYVVSRRIQATHLSAVDRSLGFLFGMFRGLLLMCLLYIVVDAVFRPDEGEKVDPKSFYATLRDARTEPMLATGAGWLKGFAPDKGLSIEDLTKNVSLSDKAKPSAPEGSAAPAKPSEGYGSGEREGLNRMLDVMKGAGQ